MFGDTSISRKEVMCAKKDANIQNTPLQGTYLKISSPKNVTSKYVFR